MTVSKVFSEGNSLQFAQKDDQLEIEFPLVVQKNQNVTFSVDYSGIPSDGLIISKNQFGDRTFFGDNWPNRARYWLPTIDHPSDKATLEFRVVAPEYYQVVSNGIQVEESNIANHRKLTRWQENVPISTKLMVIGVARFAELNNGSYNGTPVSTWVFPQNREAGFYDYAVGIRPLEFYSMLVGPYPFEKLANVQSKTRYGGMENAGCIFYAEKSVTGKGRVEGLMAHEIAHQWFGNSVTERNWYDVWLSEGFATYLTHLYTKQFAGNERFKMSLTNDRERIIKYAQKRWTSIIDTTITDYNQLLNTNTYQKASWFLHMLNEKTGDSVFVNILRKYYESFRDSTAITSDFLQVAETVSKQNLDNFFHEWLYQPGFPKIKMKWRQRNNGKLVLNLEQVQPDYLFTFPLEIRFQQNNGNTILETVEITGWKSKLNFDLENQIESIQLDPNVKLLFEKVD
jgi:aminopeptidase N